MLLFRYFCQIKNKYGGLKKPGGKFYDIGSGTGKPVRLLVSFLHCGCTLLLVLLVLCASPKGFAHSCLDARECVRLQAFAAALLHDFDSVTGIEVRPASVRACMWQSCGVLTTMLLLLWCPPCFMFLPDLGGLVHRIIGVAGSVEHRGATHCCCYKPRDGMPPLCSPFGMACRVCVRALTRSYQSCLTTRRRRVSSDSLDE